MINKNRAFTLVELMVVIAILGLLLKLAIPNIARARQQATGAQIQAELKVIYDTTISYFIDNDKYPTTWDDLKDYINIDKFKDDYEINPL